MIKTALKIILVGFLFFITLIMASFSVIYSSVYKKCIQSMDRYGGDCVESSISKLNSEKSSISEKNDAIWVLGQLADPRALPTLKMYYNSVPEEKEPLDEVLSQYELKKAIKWCENGNWTNFMYKKL